jgi:hypothetical protein
MLAHVVQGAESVTTHGECAIETSQHLAGECAWAL